MNKTMKFFKAIYICDPPHSSLLLNPQWFVVKSYRSPAQSHVGCLLSEPWEFLHPTPQLIGNRHSQ